MHKLPPDTHKTVGFVFQTERAREAARLLLAQKIGTQAFIVAPKELVNEAWGKHATRHCRSSYVWYLDDGGLTEPLGFLAGVDALCVIANEQTSDFSTDLMLPPSIEDLLWLAFELGIEWQFCLPKGDHLPAPEVILGRRGVHERVAAQKAQRATVTRALKEIRLDNDFGGSGLVGTPRPRRAGARPGPASRFGNPNPGQAGRTRQGQRAALLHHDSAGVHAPHARAVKIPDLWVFPGWGAEAEGVRVLAFLGEI